MLLGSIRLTNSSYQAAKARACGTAVLMRQCRWQLAAIQALILGLTASDRPAHRTAAQFSPTDEHAASVEGAIQWQACCLHPDRRKRVEE